MKKKDLLNMPVMQATKQMIKMAQNNRIKTKTITHKYSYGGGTYKETRIECEYGTYFRAAVVGDVLRVSIYYQSHLQNGMSDPTYDVYISKSEDKYLTYDYDKCTWRTAKIDYLHYPDRGYIRTNRDWQTEGDRKLVNEYFKTGKNLSIYQAVLEFQNEIKKDQLARKHRSEIEEIDAVMNEVPELPKKFDNWVIKNCFRETLFYEKEKPYKWPKVYCTHCGKWMDSSTDYKDRPEHGKETKCPQCKAPATYRSWNKQKYVDDEVYVAVIQRMTDETGYILRKFKCRINRRHDKGWENMEFTKSEYRRTVLNGNFIEEETYWWDEYKHTGITRWCKETHRTGYSYYSYYYNPAFGQAYMYTENMKRELRKEQFSNVDFKKIFYGGKRKSVEPAYRLHILKSHPYMEYLIKSGLNELVTEIFQSKEDKDLFDESAATINEVLKLDKQRFKRLRKWDGGSDVLRALQHERFTGEKITDKNLSYIKTSEVDVNRVQAIAIRVEQNLQRMLNYLERQQEITGQSFELLIGHYEDYIDMAVGRGMDITDEIVCRQTRMMEFHDRYLDDKNRDKNRERDRIVDNKFAAIRENYKKNVERFSFETEDLKILVPKKASDITKEGRVQHHCVGASDTYLSRMNNEQTFILFLRKKKQPKMAYYTLEVTWDGEVRQFYAAYDRQPDKEEIVKVLKEFTKEVQKRETKIQKEQEAAAIKLNLTKAGKIGNKTLMAAAI